MQAMDARSLVSSCLLVSVIVAHLGQDCLHQSPAAGVIPAQFKDQLAAQRLAMCNDIGEAAYTDSLIAAALYEHLARLPKARCCHLAIQMCYAD